MAETVRVHEWFFFRLMPKESRRCDSPEVVGNNVGRIWGFTTVRRWGDANSNNFPKFP